MLSFLSGVMVTKETIRICSGLKSAVIKIPNDESLSYCFETAIFDTPLRYRPKQYSSSVISNSIAENLGCSWAL